MVIIPLLFLFCNSNKSDSKSMQQVCLSQLNTDHYGRGVEQIQSLLRLKTIKRQRKQLNLNLNSKYIEHKSHLQNKQNSHNQHTFNKLKTEAAPSFLINKQNKMPSFRNLWNFISNTPQNQNFNKEHQYLQFKHHLHHIENKNCYQLNNKKIDQLRKVRKMHQQFQKEKSILISSKLRDNRLSRQSLSHQIKCQNIRTMTYQNFSNRDKFDSSSTRIYHSQAGRYSDIPVQQFIYQNTQQKSQRMHSRRFQIKLEQICSRKNSNNKQKGWM